jgi:hypothetical protein
MSRDMHVEARTEGLFKDHLIRPFHAGKRSFDHSDRDSLDKQRDDITKVVAIPVDGVRLSPHRHECPVLA